MPSKPKGALSNSTLDVLRYLFDTRGADPVVGHLAHHFQMQRRVAEYQLEQLQKHDLARLTGLSIDGEVFWNLTSNGRAYVVENYLIEE